VKERDPVPSVHGWFPTRPPTPAAFGLGALTNAREPMPMHSRDARDMSPRLPVGAVARASLRLVTFLLLGCGGSAFSVADVPPPDAATLDEADIARLGVAVDDAGLDAPDAAFEAEATVEATQPLSPQFAALAKQKRAAQIKEAELKFVKKCLKKE
jgi:hypothetical protein